MYRKHTADHTKHVPKHTNSSNMFSGFLDAQNCWTLALPLPSVERCHPSARCRVLWTWCRRGQSPCHGKRNLCCMSWRKIWENTRVERNWKGPVELHNLNELFIVEVESLIEKHAIYDIGTTHGSYFITWLFLLYIYILFIYIYNIVLNSIIHHSSFRCLWTSPCPRPNAQCEKIPAHDDHPPW